MFLQWSQHHLTYMTAEHLIRKWSSSVWGRFRPDLTRTISLSISSSPVVLQRSLHVEKPKSGQARWRLGRLEQIRVLLALLWNRCPLSDSPVQQPCVSDKLNTNVIWSCDASWRKSKEGGWVQKGILVRDSHTADVVVCCLDTEWGIHNVGLIVTGITGVIDSIECFSLTCNVLQSQEKRLSSSHDNTCDRSCEVYISSVLWL